jgi:perosamine synthetase
MARKISSPGEFEVGEHMIIPHSRPSVDEGDIRAVGEVLRSGRIAQGVKVEEFEDALAHYVGKKCGVACSSGTAALHLALLGLGVESGAEVIMPSYVCSAPYFAAVQTATVPRIVDIDISNFNICSDAVKPHITPMTKAIIVPHMFGNPADLEPLQELGIPIIEDCAQSLGAEYRSRRAGSFGELSVFSFYATKMITTGEGGMLLTDSDEIYARLVELRDYDKKTLIPTKYNYKMTDLQASLGLSQLDKLPKLIERRSLIASTYTEAFSGVSGIELPNSTKDSRHIFYRYVVTIQRNMEQVREMALGHGITCEKPIFRPLHNNFIGVECPNSDRAQCHALSIPLYPSLTDEEVCYTVEKVGQILQTGSRSN